MVEFLLSEQGYTVVTAESADAALVEIEQQLPDLLLLDVNLPEINGFELYTQLRERGLDIPVIFLTAKGEIDDRVQGLTMGADDYIAKPFQPAELAARIQAVLRRYQRASGPLGQTIHTSSLMIDPVSMMVTRPDGRVVSLTPTEMKMLVFLARRPGQAVSRDEALEDVWGDAYGGDSNVVDVYIRRLRQKLERDPNNPQLLQVERGVGYKLVEP
jgi:two-component system alkaline phosphatase synthesis response regulator PhoP